MNKNTLHIIIHRPIEEVFEFTTNPLNTHLRISSIKQELSDIYPPEIGTIYKNTSNFTDRDYYKVKDFRTNEKFILTDLQENYCVQYSYKWINDNTTELEYYEYMTTWELINPFSYTHLEKLKLIMENNEKQK